MRETVTKVISGRKFEITPLPAGIAVKALTRLCNALGPAIANVGSINAAMTAVLDAMGMAMEKLDGDNLEALCRTFATTTRAESVSKPGEMLALAGVFDMYFAGDMGTLAQWFYAVCEVNYASFFLMLKERFAANAAILASDTSISKSPQASTGQSTASP